LHLSAKKKMATSTWDIDGHRVSLTHNYWSGVATLTVDEEVIFRRPSAFFDMGFAHRFDIGGNPVAVRVLTNGFTFRHEFLTAEDAVQIRESNSQSLEHPFLLAAAILGMGLLGVLLFVGVFVLAFWFAFNKMG
jgi:hypothetical protein